MCRTLTQLWLTPPDHPLPLLQPRPLPRLRPLQATPLNKSRTTRHHKLRPSSSRSRNLFSKHRWRSRLSRHKQRLLSQTPRPARLPLVPLPRSLPLALGFLHRPGQRSLRLLSVHRLRPVRHRCLPAPTPRRRLTALVLCRCRPTLTRRHLWLAMSPLPRLLRRLPRPPSIRRRRNSLRLALLRLP